VDTIKKELATRVSILYYEEKFSQNEVASKLGISRSYVSQLLTYARLNSIVKIVVNVESLYPHSIRKEIEFSKYFPSVKQFYFMKSESLEDTKKHIGKFAAPLLVKLIKKTNTIAVDPGTSVERVIRELKPSSFSNCQRKKIVPLSGGIDNKNVRLHPTDFVRRLGQVLNCEYYFLNLPILIENCSSRNVLLKEKNAQEIINLWNNTDLAILGAGNISKDSTLFSSCSNSMIKEIKNSKAVGEIGVNFFDKKGNYLPLLEKYRVSIPFEKLKKIDTKVVVAFGEQKAQALISILRANLIGILISDSITAYAMEKYLNN
jgi:DNA-binding transcriptional regulator LsrR (DeoR family)